VVSAGSRDNGKVSKLNNFVYPLTTVGMYATALNTADTLAVTYILSSYLHHIYILSQLRVTSGGQLLHKAVEMGMAMATMC